jgi:nucleotide-binding universal stress UspA family protein
VKKILLCTDGSLFAASSYHYAAWIATRLAAAVDVLYVTDARPKAAAKARNWSGSIGLGASESLLNQLVELEHERARLDHQRAQLILQEAQQVLASAGVAAVRTIHETGFLVDCLHRFAAEVDLIVLGKRGESAEFASGHLGANLERIVRSSHQPCLVTSSQFRPIERLLLAYDGGASCQKLLQFLIGAPVFQGLELHVVTVAKKSGADPTASSRLNEATQQLHSAGFTATSGLIDGHPETAIVQYSEANNIDLLLMGAYGHSRLRHLVIGSTTTQILRSSHIPVLVYR